MNARLSSLLVAGGVFLIFGGFARRREEAEASE